ncbi:hypothetical protein JCM10213_005905, partial [Rhodosporidiobolus nylandii]
MTPPPRSRTDTEQLGVLTGDLAVPFFSHSSLPPLLLGEVWQLADPDNSGFLSPERFGVACRLIGHAQESGRKGAARVEEGWVGMPGPLASFSHLPLPAHLSPSSTTPASPPPAPPSRLQSQNTGSSSSRLQSRATGSGFAGADAASGAAGGKDELLTISAEDKQKYARVFAGSNGGSLAGLLD